MIFANLTNILPPAYMTANIIDDIQAISLYDVWKISCISLKNTVMALGNAQENPMEIKAPKTTTHPQPPSGGGYSGAAVAGGIFDLCLFSNQAEREKKTQGFKQLAFFCFVLFLFQKTTVFNHYLQGLERILRAETNVQLSWGHRMRVPVFKS